LIVPTITFSAPPIPNVSIMCKTGVLNIGFLAGLVQTILAVPPKRVNECMNHILCSLRFYINPLKIKWNPKCLLVQARFSPS
jgi:hypothetical protein